MTIIEALILIVAVGTTFALGMLLAQLVIKGYIKI
jgi:hypothetical protein